MGVEQFKELMLLKECTNSEKLKDMYDPNVTILNVVNSIVNVLMAQELSLSVLGLKVAKIALDQTDNKNNEYMVDYYERVLKEIQRLSSKDSDDLHKGEQ